jgi:UDP-glucose/GDP-mannose dehydrogenase family, UDP binding domain
MTPDPYLAARGADALVIMTEWDEFKHTDLIRLGSLMGDRIVVDNRNVFQPSEMERLGFTYHSVGRPAVDRAEVPKRRPQSVLPHDKKAKLLANPAPRRNAEATAIRSGGHAPAQIAARASSAD